MRARPFIMGAIIMAMFPLTSVAEITTQKMGLCTSPQRAKEFYVAMYEKLDKEHLHAMINDESCTFLPKGLRVIVIEQRSIYYKVRVLWKELEDGSVVGWTTEEFFK